jgi:hypothetical protein
MKLVTVIAAAVLFGTPLAAQQPIIDYVITPHVFAIAGTGSDEATIMGGQSLMRTKAGEPASVNLVEGGNGAKLVVVPTDLGAGRIALRVEFSLIRAGQSKTAKFDVLSGPEVQPATVAVRDGNGGFIRDELSRPIYATFDVVTRRRR